MSWLTTYTDARDELNALELELPGDPEPLAVRAAINPQDVQLPGIWLRFDGLAGPTLSGDYQHVLVTVYLAVATTDLERSLEQLEKLEQLVAPLIPPQTGPTHVALGLPGSGTPATALRYTHQLIIE